MAFDLQALVGNVGGYIGLSLGYSILQVPEVILCVVGKKRKYLMKRSTITPHTLDITVQERGLSVHRNTMEQNTNNLMNSQIKLEETISKIDEHIEKILEVIEKSSLITTKT